MTAGSMVVAGQKVDYFVIMTAGSMVVAGQKVDYFVVMTAGSMYGKIMGESGGNEIYIAVQLPIWQHAAIHCEGCDGDTAVLGVSVRGLGSGDGTMCSMNNVGLVVRIGACADRCVCVCTCVVCVV